MGRFIGRCARSRLASGGPRGQEIERLRGRRAWHVPCSLTNAKSLCSPTVLVARKGEPMDRVLLIDQDRPAMERLGLTCLERGIGVAMAETLCEGVRAMLTTPVSLIVVDAARLRLTAREHATLFERVAPGVPVVVLARADVALGARVAYELAGLRVVSRPVAVEALVDTAAAPAVALGR